MRSTHDLAARTDPTRGPRTSRPLARRLLAVAVLAGCSGLEPISSYSPITDPASLFMSLTLDYGAVNLAMAEPYDELQLTVTPRNALGSSMGGLPAPTFRSSDTATVWVTPTGLLQARKPGNGVRVIAELVADGNIRHADTAIVNVTTLATPPRLDVLSIQPATPESAVWAMFPSQAFWGFIIINNYAPEIGNDLFPRLSLRALDANGEPISGLAIEYESLDPDIVVVEPTNGSVSLPHQPGEARVVARTMAYGISKADTARFTATLPRLHGVVIRPGSNNGPPIVAPKMVTIRPGGYVVWTNLTTDSVSVTFDEPAGATAIAQLCAALAVFCKGGDIPRFMGTDYMDHSRLRQFVEPGSYTFHIEPLGVTGRVVVADALP